MHYFRKYHASPFIRHLLPPMIGLVGTVTGLEDRHSMPLQGFFDFLGKNGFD